MRTILNVTDNIHIYIVAKQKRERVLLETKQEDQMSERKDFNLKSVLAQHVIINWLHEATYIDNCGKKWISSRKGRF